MSSYKIIHYINQFFGQIGGEQAAYQEPFFKEGPIGPGVFLDKALQNGGIIGTIVCGDNYAVENGAQLNEFTKKIVTQYKPDIFVAGPAFNSGRYGLACGNICAYVQKTFAIYCVTGCFEENPAADLYRSQIDVLKTKANAAGMKEAIEKIAKIILYYAQPDKINRGEYFFTKGLLENQISDQTVAQRAIAMLKSLLDGKETITEIVLPTKNRVSKQDLKKPLSDSEIVLITDGGLVPKNNPDRLPTRATTKYLKYDISSCKKFVRGEWEVAHEGYDNRHIMENPNRLVPLDALRLMEEQKTIKKVHDYMITTTGVATSLNMAKKMGREIGHYLLEKKVDAAILTST